MKLVSADGESWLPVPDTKFYWVSSLGRVWSARTNRVLKQSPTRSGYMKLNIHGKTRPVHQLVALAFIGPRPAGQETRHKDGNHLRNHADNLAYGTHSANMQDAIQHGTFPGKSKTHCPNGHPYDEANTILREDRPGTRACRACHSKHLRDRRRAGGGNMPHGHSKYTTEGCRCDICRAAQAAYGRTWRARKRSRASEA